MDIVRGGEEALIRNLRDIGRRFSAEYWREMDRTSAFPDAFWSALGESGWTGVLIPQEYGGLGLGATGMALACEEISAAGGGAGAGLMFLISSVFGAAAILRGGSEAQRRRYLPGIADGSLRFSLGLTEPDAGSNTFAISTVARREAGRWRIDGQKVFISGIGVADAMILVARTGETSRGRPALGLFIVDHPREQRGFSYKPLEKLGTHYFDTSQVWLDGLYLPEESLLGDPSDGWTLLLQVLNPERIATAATAIGVGRLVLERAVAYANQRRVFGRLIGANQALAHPLAEARIGLEAARLLTRKAADRYDQGLDCGAEANMAKYLAVESATQACDRALQTFGGYGYMVDYDIERHWRDLRLLQLAPISQQMVLNFVAEHVLGLPKSY